MLLNGSGNLSAGLSLFLIQSLSIFWEFANVQGRPYEGSFLSHSPCEGIVKVKW